MAKNNTIDIKELIEICKTCPKRNKQDNMYFMAYWSYCQTECKFMKRLKRMKKNFEK
jgi:hypothetical protein